MKITHVFIDFDGTLTTNQVYVFEDGREAVCCSRADGIGIQMLKDLGIEVIILSTEINNVVTARADKLKVRCVQNCKDKEEYLLANIGDLSKVAFIGNDVNDLEAMKMVGYPIAVADAHGSLIEYLRWYANDINVSYGFMEPYYKYRENSYITKSDGGHGAVREACEYIVGVVNDKL